MVGGVAGGITIRPIWHRFMLSMMSHCTSEACTARAAAEAAAELRETLELQ